MSPDGSKIVPPEEKLLRLIRGKGAESAPSPQASPSAGGAPSPAPGLSPGPAGMVLARSAAGRWKAPTWLLTAVNVVLGCAAVGLLIAVVLVAMTPLPVTTESPVAVSPNASPTTDEPPPVVQTESAAPLSAAAGHPLFVSPVSSGTKAPGASVPLGEEAKALAGRLNVLGIVDGDPMQAIIEDSQSKKTYFVSVGQQVVDGLSVAEVRKDRVILELNGQRIELSL